MEHFYQFVNFAIDLGLVFGPTSGYYFQYNLIKKTKSLGTFSTYICAILIFANLLRIFFWFGERFEIALLFQSIAMIIVQLILLEECIKVKHKHSRQTPAPALTPKEKYTIKNFWKWNDYNSYIQVIMITWGSLAVLTFIFTKSKFYTELLGCASVIIEACLGLPQLISNMKNKSTAGLSMGLILVWFTGDLAKTLYFIIKDQPLQFILCGFTQLTIDISIIFQIYKYGRKEYQEMKKGNKYDQLLQGNMIMLQLLSRSEDDIESRNSLDSRETLIWY